MIQRKFKATVRVTEEVTQQSSIYTRDELAEVFSVSVRFPVEPDGQ